MNEHIVFIRDKKVRYLEKNVHAPDTLVILHGIGSTANTFIPLSKEFKKNIHLIALDFPGRGSTELTSNTIESFSDWLKEFLEYLGLEKVSLLGTSLGGAVAFKFSHKYPEMVKKLIVVAPPISSHEICKSRKTLLQFVLWVLNKSIIIKGITKLIKKINDKWLSRLVKVYAALNRKWKRDIYENLDKESILYTLRSYNLAALKDLLQDLKIFDLRNILSEITAPTLAIMGGKDEAVNPESLNKMEKLIPNITAKLFPEENHMIFLVKPKLLAETILEFLQY